MEKKKNNCGPAFPHERFPETGMTLRDYFAAKAMQAIGQGTGPDMSLEQIAAFSYQMADAMLKAREQ